MTGFTPELVERLNEEADWLSGAELDGLRLSVGSAVNVMREAASGIAELTEALRELRAEVQRLLLTTQADTKRADCPVMAVAKASAKAGNVLAKHRRSK